MLSPQYQNEFERRFPFIARAGTEFKQEFYSACRYIELPAHASICEEGQQCAQLAMLLEDVHIIHGLGSISTAHSEADLSLVEQAYGRAAERIKASL